MIGEELFEVGTPEYVHVAQDVTDSVYTHLTSTFELLKHRELANRNDDAACIPSLGFPSRSYCISSLVYASFLMRRFQHRGGCAKQYTLVTVEEAFLLVDSVSIVVNCPGMGSGTPRRFQFEVSHD